MYTTIFTLGLNYFQGSFDFQKKTCSYQFFISKQNYHGPLDHEFVGVPQQGWMWEDQRVFLLEFSVGATVDGSEIPRPTTVWMLIKPCK